MSLWNEVQPGVLRRETLSEQHDRERKERSNAANARREALRDREARRAAVEIAARSVMEPHTTSKLLDRAERIRRYIEEGKVY